jgi:hypothetical protein
LEIATGKLKSYKFPDTDQILAELVKVGGDILGAGIGQFASVAFPVLLISTVSKYGLNEMRETPQCWISPLVS